MLNRLRIGAPLIFCVLIAVVGIFLSEYLNLYALWSEYDTFLHLLGGIGIAWLGTALLGNDVAPLSAWKKALIFVSFAAFIGLLWEFAEFLAGFARGWAPWLWHWFHGGGLADTLLDLAADIAGALTFAIAFLSRKSA
jgi:hypothetical protein